MSSSLTFSELWAAVESLTERAMKNELGDQKKALEAIRGIALSNGIKYRHIEAIFACVRDDLNGVMCSDTQNIPFDDKLI